MKKRIIILDGNSLMFRAYYATAYTGNLMQTSTGLYTNALYGFANMLTKIQNEFEPAYMLVAFDKGKATFRHQMLATYKGTRKHMPEELAMQLPIIREYLDVLGIKRLELDEYEADDIVGSMAKLASSKGFDAICLSGDKDLLQLVAPNTKVMLTIKGISELDEYNSDNFAEKMGFAPDQMIDYKAIIGDNSDNLAGVRGVGPKTAVSLLSKYHDLDGIYEHIDELTPKTKDAFLEAKEISHQTKFLATIYQDIVFDFGVEDCLVKPIDYTLLRQFYEKVEFTSFIKKMAPVEEKPATIEIVKHFNEVDLLSAKLATVKNFYFDTELDDENYHKASVLGVSFLVDNEAFFIDKMHFLASNLGKYLSDETKEKYCLDAKKSFVALQKLGLSLQNVTFDFGICVYLINPLFASLDMKTMAEHFCKSNLSYTEDIYGKKSHYVIPDFEVYATFACEKLAVASKLKDQLLKELTDLGMMKLFTEIEMPLALVLAKVELNGFMVDSARLDEVGFEFETKIKALEEEAYRIVGRPFNLASPKQLGVILFDELKIAKGKKNKTGYSTSAEVLESLRSEHELVGIILEYRKFAKLLSTYVVGLKSEIASDGKVHTTFKQTLTQTGRLSSVEPNIQNIPTRDEEGKVIRSAFVASDKDGLLISADYSQIELRVLAEASKCESMINDFNHGLDLHTSTASKISNVSYNEVTKDMRRMAKTVNFGIVYGMSDWGLSETLHISPIEASIFIDKYFAIYPEIKTYLDGVVQDATKNGYTTTLFGRRRYIPELASSNYALRQFGERTSKNAPIQGSAADIIKLAMVRVDEAMVRANLKSKMVAQVHDELIIDACRDEIEIIKHILKEEMENVVKLNVQLTVDVESGHNWDLK